MPLTGARAGDWSCSRDHRISRTPTASPRRAPPSPCSGRTTTAPPSASDDPEVRRRLGSVGHALPGVEVRDPRRPTTRWPIPRGAASSGCAGEQVSGEYLGTRVAARRRGLVPHARSRLTRRRRLPVHRGTHRRHDHPRRREHRPAEIEDVLLRHEGVAEAAVVGAPDDEWGQRLVAVVVAHPNWTIDPEELRQWAKTQLRSSKTPDEILVWDELPQTATGKVIRRQILARLER